MFHAVAGPVSSSATTITVDTPMLECMSFHCNDVVQDDEKATKCCPGAVALQPTSQLQVIVSRSRKSHVSSSSSLIRHSPNILFRPPKFYPFLAG